MKEEHEKQLESINKSMGEMFRQHDYRAMYDFYTNYINPFIVQALSQSEWISVDDRLPKIDTSNKWNNDNKITKDVLCYSKEWGMRFGRYFHLAGFWTVNGVTSSKGIDVEFWKEINPPQTK